MVETSIEKALPRLHAADNIRVSSRCAGVEARMRGLLVRCAVAYSMTLNAHWTPLMPKPHSQVSLDKARRIWNVDRLFLISLVVTLLERGALEARDVDKMRAHAKAILQSAKTADEPVLLLHLEEVEAEFNHLLDSFRLR
jgi:hypothetical protein